MSHLNRRAFLHSAALASGSVAAAGYSHSVAATATSRPPDIRTLPAQTKWTAAPPQVPAAEGIAILPGGARLWYWDTGGNGEPLVLVHAASGSAQFWEYQQPVLARAGYRVIAYSQRGHYNSEPLNPTSPGTGSGDLHELVQYLGVDRLHLIGTAAGGGIALDYAVSHQDRLLSLTVANSLGGISDPDYSAITQAILPAAFFQAPADFRELGPSYRAGYRPGVARWLALQAVAGSTGQPFVNQLTWPTVETVRVPTQLLTGDADLYMPPSRLREFARHLSRSEVAIFSEAGHSPYWEEPEIFNRELLKFLRRHRCD
jgi:pimeloyl-ACP methyl ester carboxylesterase